MLKKNIVLVLLSCCTFLHGAEKLDKTKLGEMFTKNGQWCFFTTQDSKYNRLTYVDKNKYKICKEGDLFKKISYKGKDYARDLNKQIYRPHWQMKEGFNSHLIPVKKYIRLLDNKIKSTKKDIQKSKLEVSKTQRSLEYSQKKYEKMSEYKKHTTHKTRFGSRARALAEVHKDRIKNYKKDIDDFNKKLKNSENALNEQKAFKTKIKALYKKYAINN